MGCGTLRVKTRAKAPSPFAWARGSVYGKKLSLYRAMNSVSANRIASPYLRDAGVTDGLLLAFSAAISKATPVMGKTQSESGLDERRLQKGLGDVRDSWERLFSQRSGGNQ